MSTPIKICFECDAPATCEHHVVPRSYGGTRTVPLCDRCHSLVHTPNKVRLTSTSELIKRANERDHEHFRLQIASAWLLGLVFGFTKKELLNAGIIDPPKKLARARVLMDNDPDYLAGFMRELDATMGEDYEIIGYWDERHIFVSNPV